jgi:hypothetical protein
VHRRGLALLGGLLDHNNSSHGLHSHGLHSNSVEVLCGVIGKRYWQGARFWGDQWESAGVTGAGAELLCAFWSEGAGVIGHVAGHHL